MNVLMVLDRNYTNLMRDARVLKEIHTLLQFNYEVTIAINDVERKNEQNHGFHIIYAGTDKKEYTQNYNIIDKAIWAIKYAYHSGGFKRNVKKMTKNIKYDYYHLHDYETLSLAKFLSKRGKVIYDSHEYWAGHRSLTKAPGKYIKNLIKISEYKLVNKYVHEVITVSDSIAFQMMKVFTKEITVIKNIPRRNFQENIEIEKKIKDLKKNNFILLYEGNISPQRGVDYLIKLIRDLSENVILVILGDGSDRELIEAMLLDLNMEKRVHILGFQPYNQILSIIKHADLAVIPIQGLSESYNMALPNKFFDAILATLPILSTNLIEMSNIIDKYENGLTFNYKDKKSFKNQFYKIYENYSFYKKNAELASKDFSWEIEEKKLLNLYKKMEGKQYE